MHLYQNPDQYNGEGWNFGPSSQSIKTVLELTNLLKTLWDDVEIEIDQHKNHPHEANLLHLSIDKAQTLLKWKPKYDFEEAVMQTGEWYRRIQQGEDAVQITSEQIAHFMER
jgi:CDP-glucose 4,6-dehydratase